MTQEEWYTFCEIRERWKKGVIPASLKTIKEDVAFLVSTLGQFAPVAICREDVGDLTMGWRLRPEDGGRVLTFEQVPPHDCSGETCRMCGGD
jgi:hypothetical protein